MDKYASKILAHIQRDPENTQYHKLWEAHLSHMGQRQQPGILVALDYINWGGDLQPFDTYHNPARVQHVQLFLTNKSALESLRSTAQIIIDELARRDEGDDWEETWYRENTDHPYQELVDQIRDFMVDNSNKKDSAFTLVDMINNIFDEYFEGYDFKIELERILPQ